MKANKDEEIQSKFDNLAKEIRENIGFQEMTAGILSSQDNTVLQNLQRTHYSQVFQQLERTIYEFKEIDLRTYTHDDISENKR